MQENRRSSGQISRNCQSEIITGRTTAPIKRGGQKTTKRAFERTSYEVRQRWDKENLKRYVVSFRIKEDANLIEYIESHKSELGTTELFRNALQNKINEG